MIRACELALRRGFRKIGVVSSESERIYQRRLLESAHTTETSYNGGQWVSSAYFPARYLTTSHTEGEVRAVALLTFEVDQFQNQGLTFVDTEAYVREHDYEPRASRQDYEQSTS